MVRVFLFNELQIEKLSHTLKRVAGGNSIWREFNFVLF